MLLLLTAFSLCCSATSDDSDSSYDEEQIFRKDFLMRGLLHYYDTDVEPPVVSRELNTTVVAMGLNVLCAAPVGDFVSIESWVSLHWTDARLRWRNRWSHFEGIDRLHISTSRIWTPDLRLYNAMKTQVNDVKAVVTSDGNVYWIPPVNYLVRCNRRNGTHCSLKFGSWTYSGNVVDLREMNESGGVALADYSPVCPTVVHSHDSRRTETFYECCPGEPYVSIIFNLQLAWR